MVSHVVDVIGEHLGNNRSARVGCGDLVDDHRWPIVGLFIGGQAVIGSRLAGGMHARGHFINPHRAAVGRVGGFE